MAKKYNRCRPQKRNIDPRKLDRYREEIAREMGLEIPKKHPGEDRSVSINLNHYRNPLI